MVIMFNGVDTIPESQSVTDRRTDRQRLHMHIMRQYADGRRYIPTETSTDVKELVDVGITGKQRFAGE